MNRKLLLGHIEVDNPLYAAEHPGAAGNPRKVHALVNKRESALVTLHIRKSIDERQFLAGLRFAGIWEIHNGMRGGSFSEHVDGYRQVSISISVIDAGREMGRCKTVLTRRQYRLMCEVCGQGKAISETSYVWEHGRNRDMARRLATLDIADALDELAYMWGLGIAR